MTLARHIAVAPTAGSGRRSGMLPELLVVLVILGVLAAIVVSGVSTVKSQAELTACRSAVEAASTAAQVYLARHSRYPQDVAALRSAGYLSGGQSRDRTLAYTVRPDGQGFSLSGTTSNGTVCASTTS